MHLSWSEGYFGGLRIGHIIGRLTQYRSEHATWYHSLVTESNSDCRVEFRGPRLFKRIPHTTRLKHPQEIISCIRDGPSQQNGIRRHGLYPARGFRTIHTGHLHIQQHDVGSDFRDQGNCLFAGRRFAEPLEIFRFLQDGLRRNSSKPAIVDDHHANRFEYLTS